VSRDEVVDRLWGKDVFLDVETGIHGAIRKIRLALRDVPAASDVCRDRPRERLPLHRTDRGSGRYARDAGAR
jgi:hypothetical protein